MANKYYQMHSLKSTLGKNNDSDEPSKSGGNPSKTFSKVKNGSIWALDPEEDNQQQNAKDFNLNKIKEFERTILNAFQKDAIFSQIIFFQIIQQIQGISEGMDEQIRLQIVEKAAIKTNETQVQNLKNFVAGFLECLAKRIKKLKKKQKKIELQQYDKIIKTNFKKKVGAQFIDEAGFDSKEKVMKPIRNNAINGKSTKAIDEGSTSKRNGSASSNEGKLAKLISNVSLKDEKKQEENEEVQNHEESISFSSVVSQSMAVRQRRNKEPKNKEKQQVPQKLQQKQSEGNDAAFIFYRPKAGKKK